MKICHFRQKVVKTECCTFFKSVLKKTDGKWYCRPIGCRHGLWSRKIAIWIKGNRGQGGVAEADIKYNHRWPYQRQKDEIPRKTESNIQIVLNFLRQNSKLILFGLFLAHRNRWKLFYLYGDEEGSSRGRISVSDGQARIGRTKKARWESKETNQKLNWTTTVNCWSLFTVCAWLNWSTYLLQF